MRAMKHSNSNESLSLQLSIPFHVLRWYPKSGILCAILESTLTEITQCNTYIGDWCFQKLLPPTLYIKRMIWNPSAAMDVFTCSTASHFPWSEATPNLAFCVQFESQPWQKFHSVINQWLSDAFWSSSNLPYVSKEGYEPLQQQYNMSLLVAQYPISYAERICKIWHLCAIWESTSPETTQPDTWWACICCKKNLSYFSWIWWRLWNTSTAMEVSACSILSHLSL